MIAPPLAFRNAARGAITDDLLDDLRDDLRDDLHNDLRDAYWPSARGPRTDPFGGELRIEREIDRDAPRPPLTAPAPVRRGPPNHAGSDHGAITGRADARWSSQSLRALGLPDRIVDAAMVQRPVSEADWIVALMGAFRTICEPRPVGPIVMVGPNCANLARQLRLVSISPDELAESVSSVAIPNVGAATVRFGLNDRQVHLMVGGAWQHLSNIEPAIVSAATTAELLEAIRVCVAWDASLGWCWADDHYERLEAFTVVAHVRSVLYAADQASPVHP